VQIQIEGIVFAQARAGKMRLLGVTTAKRYSEFPDVPAIAEVVPGFSFDNWFGFIFPAGVPEAAIQRANAVLRAAAEAPDVIQRFLPVGLEPRVDTPAEMLADMRRQSERYAKLMRELDIKLE
jgi:tripartite-type tricarboxylate transporter receptor subunit TctC